MLKKYKISNNVCKLNKVLYDLKQSSHFSYERLSKFLLNKLNFTKFNVDHNIFSIEVDIKDSIIILFVNDLNVISLKKFSMIIEIKIQLRFAFQIIDMNLISYYTDLKIERNRFAQILILSQSMYIEKILDKFFMRTTKSAITSIKENDLFKNES